MPKISEFTSTTASALQLGWLLPVVDPTSTTIDGNKSITLSEFRAFAQSGLSINAGDILAGTLSIARLPTGTTSGTLPVIGVDNKLPASIIPTIGGAIDAGDIVSGTINAARLPDLSLVYQPLDADLSAIAALTTTSFGRGILTQSDAANARAYLGISSSSGALLAANNLNDLSNVANARANLGLGTSAVLGTGTTSGTIPVIGVGNTLPSSVIPIITEAQLPRSIRAYRPNIPIAASKSFALTDGGTKQLCSNASAITLTVQPQSSIAWEDNTEIDLVSIDAGTVTIGAGAGVTVNRAGTGALQLRRTGAAATLIRTAVNVWWLLGDLV